MNSLALPSTAVLFLLSACAVPLPAQAAPTVRDSGRAAPASIHRLASDDPLQALSFMSGCWRSSGDAGSLEEQYTAADGNVMLGTSRFWRGGRVVQFEFSRITADSSGVTLLPYPGGSPSEHAFRLTRATGDSAVFEAPEHDFPKRIVYSRGSGAFLVARIDDGENATRAQEWRMQRVDCAVAR